MTSSLGPPLPSTALTHGIPPSRSLKMPELALLKSRVVIRLTSLLRPCRILNSTISCHCKPRLLSTFTSSTSPSLFISTRSGSTPLLLGFSTWTACACCVVFPADVRVVPHENQGLGSWGYFHLSVEGLDFLFLIRWPVVHTHSVTYMANACPLILTHKISTQ